MSLVVLHLIRPYGSEEEYLEAEAWTIDSRGMLLLDQTALDAESIVAFDVALANGRKVIRAEARVLPTPAGQARGLRVRFRRFGAQTKAFIDRALAARQAQMARRTLHASSAPPAAHALASNESPRSTPKPSALESRSGGAPSVVTKVPFVATQGAARSEARSGIRRRPVTPIATPPNRDELLNRLRQRTPHRRLPASNESSKKAR